MQSSRPVHHRQSFRRFCVLLGVSLFVLASALSAQSEGTRTFNIPADVAEKTLKLFSEQSGRGLIMNADTVGAVRTNAVQGDLKPADALARMLANTALVATEDRKSGSYVVKLEKAPAEKNAPSRPASDRAATDARDGILKLDTFEVMGTKLLNMDIRRTRDDAQPYVVFEREHIEQSGATNLEDFLKQRLTMNASAISNSQTSLTFGNMSTIDLRGLGANQTLILIDGHRAMNAITQGTPRQPDVNGIPLAAIERIEILPSTASGIYGGGATGGVVNIILRRDYAGVEFKATYENSFDTDTALRRAEFSAGFNLEGGKTNVLLAASYSHQNQLLVQDRDYVQKGRAAILANNPAFYLTGAIPPLGSTANIRSTTGVLLTLRSNGAPLNSAFTHVPAGYAGPASDGGAALVARAGTYNFALADSAQPSGGGRAGLRNGPEITSFSATVRRQFGPNVQAFVDAFDSENRGEFMRNVSSGSFTLAAGVAGNPFNQAIRVLVPIAMTDSVQEVISRDRRVVGGVIVQLPRDWRAEADYSWSRTRLSFVTQNGIATTPATAAASAGTLDLFRDPALFPLNITAFLQAPVFTVGPHASTSSNVTGRVAGPVFDLPAGPVTLSALLERREDDFANSELSSAGTIFFYPRTSQQVSSAYLEMKIPVFSTAQRASGFQSLELQLAGRFDEYEIDGANGGVALGAPFNRFTRKLESVNPTVGVRYEPITGVVLRASYGTGFLPPQVNQLVPAPLSAPLPIIDPRRGNASTTAFVPSIGGNPALRPEESESFSAGVVLTNASVPGLRVSVDYTLIDKTDNITNLGVQGVVDNELLLPQRVTRGPVPPGDPFGVGPITSVDITLINIARARSESYDVAVDWSRKTSRFGNWSAFALATWQTHYETQLTSAQPLVENVGVNTGATSSIVLKLKGNLGLTWKQGPWTVGWNMRYFDSYWPSTNAAALLNQGGNGRVPSQEYHDVFVSRRWADAVARAGSTRVAAAACRVLRNSEVQLGMKNVFNKKGPFDAGNAPTTAGTLYSPFADVREAVYYISVKKAL